MSQSSIPVLDLERFASDRTAFVQELGKGYAEWGFAGIVNHGISDEILQQAYTQIKAFFALDQATKDKYILPGMGGARGYTGFGVEHAKDSDYPDLKEFWHVGRELPAGELPHPSLLANLWVEELPEFKPALLNLYQALDTLGGKMLSAMALYLGLEEHYFADKVNRGNSILRPIHYPPVAQQDGLSVRSAQHEDINFITLLIGAEEPGLEVLSKKGEWVPINAIPGTIVCNIGDMLQRLTNHVLPSTTHRVVNPQGERSQHPRYSIPFFLHPNPDFVIETLPGCITADNPNRYPEPITADDYLKQRLREIGLL